MTDSSGALLGINRYDEFGQPQSSNIGTWGYTGQAWLPSVGVWYYKARNYDPELGRFLQTDPIDILGGINLYAYVGNDPVNFIDPLGLVPAVCAGVTADGCALIVVTGPGSPVSGGSAGGASGGALGPGRRPIAGFNVAHGPDGPKKTKRDYCAGYGAIKTAQDVLDTGSDLADYGAKIIDRTRLALTPYGQAYSKGLSLASTITGVGSGASGVYLALKYGDYASGLNGINSLVGQTTLVGRGYGAAAKALGFKNSDLGQFVAGQLLGKVDFGQSGMCAKQ